MAYIRKIKGSLVRQDFTTYLGEAGNLFHNVDTGCIMLSDGVTPGGIPACGGGATPPITAFGFKGWMNATSVGGDDGGGSMPAGAVPGGTYIDGDYVIVEVPGQYDLTTGNPVVAPAGVPLDIGDRLVFNGATWSPMSVAATGLSKGWLDATAANGGANVPNPVVDGGAYVANEYVIVLVPGVYNLTTGLPDPLGTSLQIGDRIRYDGTNWAPLPTTSGLMKGWMDVTANSGVGAVPFPIIDGTTDYTADQYIVAETSGNYDFVTGLPAIAPLGTEVLQGQRVRYDGATWEVIPYEADTSRRITETVTLPGHGFALHQQIYRDSTDTWFLALADDELTLKDGMITDVMDVNTFKVTHYGMIDAPAHGFTLDSTYYLSDTLAGSITLTEPVAAATFSQMAFEVVTADRLKIYDQIAVDNSAVFITEY